MILQRGVIGSVLKRTRSTCHVHARRPVRDLAAVVAAKCLARRWDVSQRLVQAAEDAARQARNETARAEGRPQEFIYRKLYLPEQGMFADLPTGLALGTKQPVSWLPCRPASPPRTRNTYTPPGITGLRARQEDIALCQFMLSALSSAEGVALRVCRSLASDWFGTRHQGKVEPDCGITVNSGGNGWTRDGVAYAVGDFVYVTPDTFSVTKEASKVDTKAVPEYAAKGGHVKVPLLRAGFALSLLMKRG